MDFFKNIINLKINMILVAVHIGPSIVNYRFYSSDSIKSSY